jgi:hypothetical protein
VLRRSSIGSALLLGVLGLASLFACSEAASPSATAPAEDAGSSSSIEGGGASDAGTSSPAATIAASEYCESIADFFCDFYVRCDRMVAANKAECLTVFAETCNARYEPRYIDLERAKLLSLSRAGVDACAEHLTGVACAEQISDLDGPCGDMWTGSAPAGSKCGIDVESFICAAGTTCILTPDFCGTCEPSSPRGGPCQPGGTRCANDDACIDGECIARSLPGKPCSAAQPCVVGASCTADVCVAAEIVGEGDDCDQTHRCPYRSYCNAGTCVRGALLGEPCTATRECVSGRCEGNECVALRAADEACTSSGECSSAQCIANECAPLPSACVQP